MSRRWMQVVKTAALVVESSRYLVPACSRAPLLFPDNRQCSSKSQGAAKFKEPITEIHSNKRVINYNDLCAIMSKGNALLIDVRDATEYLKVGHITGAVNIPLAELKTALKMSEADFKEKYGFKKPKHTDENIVFYGLSDVLSAAASEIAHNLGFKKAKCYPEGWTGWCAMHNPGELK